MPMSSKGNPVYLSYKTLRGKLNMVENDVMLGISLVISLKLWIQLAFVIIINEVK